MLAILALGAAENIINQWIDLDLPTRQQLNQLQGKLLRVVVASPQLSIDVFFDAQKIRLSPTVTGMPEQTHSIFEQRPYDAKHTTQPANTTLSVNNLVQLALLIFGSTGESGNIPLQGDMHLLIQLQQIMAQAEPDLASKLAPWFGAIPAGHIAQSIQQGKQHLGRLGHSLSAHAADSVLEDSGLLAARWQMDRLQHGTRELKQQIERAQARLQQLQHRTAEHIANTTQQQAQQQQ